MEHLAVVRHLLTEAELQRKLDREYLSTGIMSFDKQTGGLPRGTITEIYGPPTSGKTTLVHTLLANATNAGEHCALVDASDSFDPASAAAAGADLRRLLWVRCHGIEQSLKATDLLVHAAGWGIVLLDVAGLSSKMLNRVPMSWWYRFRRAVENTPTVFAVIEREPFVRNCAVMAVELASAAPMWSGHREFALLRGIDTTSIPRKPIGKHPAAFRIKTSA